ncbi:hypothetical protein [Marisediminicola senii]|uniref:hypothetical protein n=1 Tax=Marisediminicola senii TaxID=2711233 RepID=UPI0013EBCF8D|nr:hypothetical protein [Marisediminicola senii]
MENDSPIRPSAREAAASLDDLAADRAAVADAVRVPRGLMAAFGGVAAYWVAGAASATPGVNYEPPTTGWLALVVALVIAHLVHREVGIRFRTMGAKAYGALAAIVLSCLALFSVSLGLVASGLTWAVVLTSLAAFALTTWLAGVAYRSALEQLRRA